MHEEHPSRPFGPVPAKAADDPRVGPVVHLRSGVHAADIEGDLAFLDIDADGYFCIPGGGAALRRDERGCLVMLAGDVAGTAATAGLTASSASVPPRTVPPHPARTVIHAPAPPIGIGQVVCAAGVVSDISRARRGAGLRPLIAVAGEGGMSCDHAAVIQAALVFTRLAPWLPVEGECLVRSAMLISFLRRSGLSADWVFGVRLWPFSAHCWVQVGDTCLNDDIERLAAYTPLYCR